MTILSFFFFFGNLSSILECHDFQNYWNHGFWFFSPELLSRHDWDAESSTWNKDLSLSETDIAFIVLSDIKAFEPIARFENTEWEYAFVFIFYNSKWEYQKMNTWTNQPALWHMGKYTVKSLHSAWWVGGVIRQPRSFQYFLHERYVIK